MANPILSEKTRRILADDNSGFNTFISGLCDLTVSIWYSAIDGNIYDKGPRNPASLDARFKDSDLRCLVVKADLNGRPLPEIAGRPQIEDVDFGVEGEPSEYAI